jgi:squalene monooxygenase
MGLVLENLRLENPSFGHMIVSGEAPILVYPIHSNTYRILVDYPGEQPPRMGTKSMDAFKTSVSALLPDEMKSAFLDALEKQQVVVMPNHRMKAQVFRKKGAVLLGDSLNMRHPLTGGGMTASFNDIITLNESLLGIDLRNESESELALQSYYKKRSAKVETINILANALYKVFRNNDLKDACFDYLEQGGEKANGPLSILAGINKNKKYLLKHFFKVAMQHPQHFVTRPRKQIRLYKNALAIMTPILRDEEKPAMI